MRTFDSSNRITYAQKKLLVLLEARQLRSWCLESNIPHTSLYKLAVGQSVPTFKAISYLVPYFAPAEWLFFMDEEIPYPIRTLLEWNPDDTFVFILIWILFMSYMACIMMMLLMPNLKDERSRMLLTGTKN